MSHADRERWERAHDEGDHAEARLPASFLVENASLLVPGRTLDIACGSGRNAAFLAAAGHRVIAIDVARAALRTARRRVSPIDVAQIDLDDAAFRPRSLDNVIMIDFLDRRLFGPIVEWLRPGGVLLVDTFLIDQREVGHPRNPAFLLEHGELRERFAAERILRYREGPVTEASGISFRAGIVAVRTSHQN
jgi:tellurite methyltransferase